MKLIELDPRWIGEKGRNGMGITFDCPCCNGETRIGVYFKNPVDGGAPRTVEQRTFKDKNGKVKVQPLWQRTGNTFDVLTLKPSINASEDKHWHGHVTNGEVK